jgi:sec-independent protein translocase protein TatB
MIDFGFDKMALIGAVALIVIGPEKLPKMARTVGHLFGKAQRYVADVKAEVNRSIEIDELKKMKTQFEDAAKGVQQSVRNEMSEVNNAFDQEWRSIHAGPEGTSAHDSTHHLGHDASLATPLAAPTYQHPKKNWRLKVGATPQWYKKRNGVRGKAQSGAARVARFRPPGVRPPR